MPPAQGHKKGKQDTRGRDRKGRMIGRVNTLCVSVFVCVCVCVKPAEARALVKMMCVCV